MWWSDNKIMFYERAANNSSFHDELTSLICKHLDISQSIIELGCGLGYITSKLYDKGFNIKGIDNDEKAITFAKKKFVNKPFILGDAFSITALPDVILCVFFGRIKEDDNLNTLLSLCKKKIIYIKNEHAGSLKTNFERTKETALFLKSKGVNFSYSSHRLSFDQPLKDEKEVSLFLAENYKKREANIKIEKTNNGFIAKNNKAFSIFEIKKEER